MNFFNSLTLDLKIMFAAMAGCALLAVFSGNHKIERRSMIVFAVLAVAGVYRFTHLPGKDQAPKSVSTPSSGPAAPVITKPKLESTHAK